MIDSTSLVRQAQRHHRAGDPRQARDLCCLVLEQNANQAGAWHLLGIIAYQARDYPLASKLLLRALSHDNANAEYHNSLGAAQYALGAVDEAVESYRRALRLHPNHADAHSNLGVALLLRKRPAESIASFRAALAVNPNHCMALNNLGNALQAQGDLEAAGVCYQRVLSLQPDHAEARNNLGGVLRALGRLEEAAEVYRQVLRQRPDMMEAHSNLGLVLHQLGRAGEALTCYRTALKLQPLQPTIHNNLGILLRENGDPEGALACFHQALALQPDSVPFHVNLGATLQQQGRLSEAMPWFRKALALDPACAVAHSNLLFALNYDTTLSAEAIFAEHCVFGRVQESREAPTRGASRPHYANQTDGERRLRIGYVSPDFRSHALMRFFLPLLDHHDSSKVEITCYAEVPRPDAITQRCLTLAHRWRSTCGLSDAQMADTIRADAIDILIDLAGHTAGNRLPVFTHRPAPVQATYMGYPNTTGLRSIDYLITDRLRHPPGEEVLHQAHLGR